MREGDGGGRDDHWNSKEFLLIFVILIYNYIFLISFYY